MSTDMRNLDEKNTEVEAMISRYVCGKMPANATRGEWAAFNSSFQRHKMTAHALAAEIWRGYSFAPVYSHGRRKKENFVSAWHIALDFDTGDENSSLELLASEQFTEIFASFAYSTPSSTAKAPKSRVVFVFPYDDPVTDMAEYEELYKALLWRFPHADIAAKDALRLFYGSPKCEVWANWSIFPDPARRVAIEQYREHLKATAPAAPAVVVKNSKRNYDKYIEGALTNLEDRISTADHGTGQRHKTLFSVGLALGEFTAASWTGLDENNTVNRMLNAATWATGQGDLKEAERVIRDGIERGKSSPREKPEQKLPRVKDLI